MRMGEVLGLKRRDIDWNQKFIRVERSYKRGQYEKTKNGKVRRVDMSDQLAASLKIVADKAQERGFEGGEGRADRMHFPSK
jgi:integrase